MKIRFSSILIVLLLIAVGIGFYRGWMVLTSSVEGEEGNKVEVNLTLDPEKAQQDVKSIGERARDMTSDKSEQTETMPVQGAKNSNAE